MKQIALSFFCHSDRYIPNRSYDFYY